MAIPPYMAGAIGAFSREAASTSSAPVRELSDRVSAAVGLLDVHEMRSAQEVLWVPFAESSRAIGKIRVRHDGHGKIFGISVLLVDEAGDREVEPVLPERVSFRVRGAPLPLSGLDAARVQEMIDRSMGGSVEIDGDVYVISPPH